MSTNRTKLVCYAFFIFFVSIHHPVLVGMIFLVFSLALLNVALIAQLPDTSSLSAIFFPSTAANAMSQLLSAFLFKLLLEVLFQHF